MHSNKIKLSFQQHLRQVNVAYENQAFSTKLGNFIINYQEDYLTVYTPSSLIISFNLYYSTNEQCLRRLLFMHLNLYKKGLFPAKNNNVIARRVS